MTSFAKELMFKETLGQFEDASYVFVSSFDQLPVEKMMELRRSLEKVSKRTMVMKHSFAKKVFQEKKYENADKFLKGSVLVTFADENPQDTSKAIVDFSKGNEKVQPEGVIFQGKVCEKAFVMRLATLPSRHELLTQVVVRVKSPITGLVMTLGQLTRGLVVALDAIKNKKAVAAQTT